MGEKRRGCEDGEGGGEGEWGQGKGVSVWEVEVRVSGRVFIVCWASWGVEGGGVGGAVCLAAYL